MRKLLVIVLDGATFDLLDPWLEQGVLPHLRRLKEEGVHGLMKSTIPVITPCAYASLLTGRRPGNTGVFDFVYREEGSYRYRSITSDAINGVPFWELLNRAGKRVGLVNVPTTFPARKINGFMVSCGLTTPDTKNDDFTYPADLFERHRLDRAAYILRPGWRALRHDHNPDAHFAEVLAMFKERAHVTLELLRREPWDFFMVHFQTTDWLQHAFWDNGDYILKGYQALDNLIGTMINTIDEQTDLIVMSDHGFGETYRTIHLTNWLIEKEFLTLHPIAFESLLLKAIDKLFYKTLKLPQTSRILATLRQFVTRGYRLVPPGLRRRLFDRPLTTLCDRLPWLYARLGIYYFDRIDWARTRAYTLGQMGALYINLAGREPQGIVSPGLDYEVTREELIRELEALSDEQGRPLIDRVYKREELFPGECVNKAPDLMAFTDARPCYFHPDTDIKGIVSYPVHWKKGNHRLHGIFFMKGRHVKKRQAIKGIEIIDIAPTIHYLMGVPLSPAFEGRILTDCFSEDYVASTPAVYADRETAQPRTAESADDDERVKRSLRGLGYL